MIYDKNWQNLSLDWNSNPIMGWLTEAWEIRQVRVNEALLRLNLKLCENIDFDLELFED